MTIAEQNQKDTDLMYALLSEGKLDLMYLPAGVIAWLWDRPDSQVSAARDLAVAAKDTCPVTGGAILRSDQNVLVLKCNDGHRFNVYPDGGYGCDGQPLDLQGCARMLDGGAFEQVPDENCPMEGGGAPETGVHLMTPDSLASDVSGAVVATEARVISLKELTYHELQNWFRKMRDQLTPPQAHGIKKLLRQKQEDEMGATSGFGATERQWQAEDEGSIIDDDKRDRAVDLICKMRSVGNPLQKALKGATKDKASENEGGVAGPIGTDMFDTEDEIAQTGMQMGESYDFEDEIPEIERMVSEELKKYR